ncbi:sulfurtransferase [Spirulina sp. CS-785/01]|uniref:sulfurtransferase n=1 Tax=Spirulina sp. CS-785/01 TaxID=3021716 RepID=UPI00232CD8D5|nr:sulfurtransferase [Spirulina sp. CS-785/01]MDB9315858.1 sulfurtransferase [Spirulina sp. CS-785/01]
MNPVISAPELAAQLDQASLVPQQLVIVDCRFQLADPHWGRQQYQKSHIRGSYYLDLDQDLSAPVGQHGGRHPLPALNVLAQKFEQMGIVLGKTLVVAYDDSKMAFASRLWWLLRYCGHDRVAVLDGGWSHWQNQGYPVSATPPPQRWGADAGQFVPQVRSNWVVDIDTVKERKDQEGVILIDSRDSDRYRGEREPLDPLAGHIPSAENFPWKETSNSQGIFHPPAEHQQRWHSLKPYDEIFVYCGSGVTACVNLMSMEMAGFNQAKLYPGGWSDWCSYLI